MALTKAERRRVWDKSDGRCWYCGCPLPERGWHADHLNPVRRVSRIERGTGKAVITGDMERPERNSVENIVPACAPCNLFKSVFTLAEFRSELERQVDRGRKASVNFRMAEKFGLIEATGNPVVFWFEKVGLDSK